jgi:ATP-dependent RNA helicase RhlE
LLQRLAANAPVHAPASGTGRTVRPIRALVLCPTRELAAQIAESFSVYGDNLDLRHTVIFGGVGQGRQVTDLKRGVDTVVATPGRLLDLIGQGYVDLRAIEILVLDEADRMLDMGFIHDIRRIVDRIPPRRQTLLFSATMPPEIRDLAASILRDPVMVEANPVASPAEAITQSVYFVDRNRKTALLRHVLESEATGRVLVFTRTKHRADRVVRDLGRAGIDASAIHGNKSQNARTRALDQFKSGHAPVLVATDIAARGIDVDEITHVINYDMPDVPETYVHRIGRTARAGASGIALSFCDRDERADLRAIERLIDRQIDVNTASDADLDAAMPPPPTVIPARNGQAPVVATESRSERAETPPGDRGRRRSGGRSTGGGRSGGSGRSSSSSSTSRGSANRSRSGKGASSSSTSRGPSFGSRGRRASGSGR